MNLYEIENEILNCVDMETGEIVDIKKLESLQMERDQKIENIGCWIKNLLSDAEALKSEKENLAKRQKVAESKAASLKEYLSRYLDGEKFKSARKKAINARIRAGYTHEDFRILFEKAEASEFLKGANKRNWRATFDWLISDTNMAKVLDGNYDARKEAVKDEPEPTNSVRLW